jgi:hypothetical protein
VTRWAEKPHLAQKKRKKLYFSRCWKSSRMFRGSGRICKRRSMLRWWMKTLAIRSRYSWTTIMFRELSLKLTFRRIRGKMPKTHKGK